MAGYHQPRQIPMESYSAKTTTTVSSSSTDDRQSQALRASVLDVALQLGLGTSNGIDKWLDGGHSAEDPGPLSSPTLTWDKSATSASEESWTPDSIHAVPNFSLNSTVNRSPYPARDPYTNLSAPNTAGIKPHLDESDLRSFSRQGGITIVDPDTLPRYDGNRAPKKLKKKRGDGYESEGYASDFHGFVKRKEKETTEEFDKKRLKEEKRNAKARAKETKKRAKKEKDVTGPAVSLAGGYETDGASFGYLSSGEPSKKSKKSKGGAGKASDGPEGDDGYQSAPTTTKKRPAFLKLRSGRSKSDPQQDPSDSSSQPLSPPPIPAIYPLPIAERFATTLAGGSRSATPMGSITPSSMDTTSASTAVSQKSVDLSYRAGRAISEDRVDTPSRSNTVRFMGELVPADSITAEDFALFARAASPPPNLARPSALSSSNMPQRSYSPAPPPVLRIPPAAAQQSSAYQASKSAGAVPSSASYLSGILGSEQRRNAGSNTTLALELPQKQEQRPIASGLVAPESQYGQPSTSPSPYLLPASSSSHGNRSPSPSQLSQLIVPSLDYVVPSPTRFSTISPRGASFAELPPPSPAPDSPLPRTPGNGWDVDDPFSGHLYSAPSVNSRPVSPMLGAGPATQRGRASPFPTRPVVHMQGSRSPKGRPEAMQLPPRAGSRQGMRSPAPPSIARYHQLGQARGQSDDLDLQYEHSQRQRPNQSVRPSPTSEQGHHSESISLMRKPSGRRRSDSDVALNRFTSASAAPPINIEQPSDGEDGDDGADFNSLFDRYAYDERSAYGGMEEDPDDPDDGLGTGSEPAVRVRGSLDLAEGIRRLSTMPPQAQSSQPTPGSLSSSSSSPTPVYPAPGSATPISTLSRKNTLTRDKPPPTHVPTTDSMLFYGDDDDDDRSIYPDDGRKTMYDEEELNFPRGYGVEKHASNNAGEMPRISIIDRDKSQRLRRALVDRVEMQYAYERLPGKQDAYSTSPQTTAASAESVKRQPSTLARSSEPTPTGIPARATRASPTQRIPVPSRPIMQEAAKPGWF